MKNFALGRLKSGVMNKTEAAYADYLEQQLSAGQLLWWKFEALKLRLAANTFYTPDFLVMKKNREIQLCEVKGYWMDDARVKIKVASEMYPFFQFTAVRPRAKKNGGGWEEEEF